MQGPKCNHVDSLTETQTRLNIVSDAPSRDTLFVLEQQNIFATLVLVSGLYAWKSILGGRDVILNGADIKIWQHHWLPIKHPLNITSLARESLEEAMVDCLFWVVWPVATTTPFQLQT